MDFVSKKRIAGRFVDTHGTPHGNKTIGLGEGLGHGLPGKDTDIVPRVAGGVQRVADDPVAAVDKEDRPLVTHVADTAVAAPVQQDNIRPQP